MIPADQIKWHDVTEFLPTEEGGEIKVRTIAGTTPDYVYQCDVPLDADDLTVERVKVLITERLRHEGKVREA